MQCAGLRAGLLGESSKSLAIWLSERLHSQEDWVVHECTGRFFREILDTYLPCYTWHSLRKDTGAISMLGQHQLGWPSHRPRLYSVGILKASSFGQLQNGLQQLKMLFCRPSIDCRSLFMAPKAGMFLANMLLFQLILPPSQTSNTRHPETPETCGP